MFELDMLSYIMGKKAGGGTAVEQVEKTVVPDFSAGDMTVLPAAGKAFSKVTVEQPENLIAENIAEGVNIAGVVGALVAGGGGSGVKIEHKRVEATSTYLGVQSHSLGVVPDIMIGWCTTSTYAEKTVDAAVGVSAAFAEKYFPADHDGKYGFWVSRGSAYNKSLDSYGLETTVFTSGFHHVTSEKFQISGTGSSVNKGVWHFILIAGLT